MAAAGGCSLCVCWTQRCKKSGFTDLITLVAFIKKAESSFKCGSSPAAEWPQERPPSHYSRAEVEGQCHSMVSELELGGGHF